MDFSGKKVLVVGAARSGLSAAKLLKSMEADVTLSDSKTRECIGDAADEMERLGVKLFLGQNAGLSLVKEQELIISSPGIPPDIETYTAARKLGIKIMGEMELAFSLCPCPVAAITGTNGKTTTSALVGEIIRRHIKDTRVVGNIGNPFTESVLSLTEKSFAVIEASSFQLEDISIFKPKISVILNITPDHLDRHKTFERYIEAKTNIFKHTDENDFVILNSDDSALNDIAVKTKARILGFSAGNEVEEGACLENGVIIIKFNGEKIKLINKEELIIVGQHNVENALAATLTAFCAGVPADVISRGLIEFKGVSHRLELVRARNGIKYYNDSKGTNTDATIKALNAMIGKTVLIAGGYNKGADFSELASLFRNKLSCIILVGDTKWIIAEACKKAGFNKYIIADDYKQAVLQASKEAAESGAENVLLSPACASWDMFSNFEERGDYFIKLVNML